MAFNYYTTNSIGAGNQITPVNNDVHIILEGVTIGSTSSTAIYEANLFRTGGFQIQGQVFGTRGIYLAPNSDAGLSYIDIAVGKNGAVGGLTNTGIHIDNNFSSISGYVSIFNEGRIAGAYDGISVTEVNGATVVNHGTISTTDEVGATYGIALSGQMLFIENYGSIAGKDRAISVDGRVNGNGQYTGLFELTNTGTVRATSENGPAIDSDNLRDVIYNEGLITGDVNLHEQDDQFLGENGTVNGTVSGGAGNDIIKTGIGDDMINGGTGRDKMYGGAGNDTATYGSSSAGVQVSLTSNRGRGGDARGDWLFDIENLIGSDYDDTLIGDAVSNILEGGDGADTLNGEGGNDFLFGELGDDTLIAGDGDDILNGGLGRDILWSGDGADIFEFLDIEESGTGTNRDVIKDFEQGLDLIDFSAIGATSFSDSGFTNTAGEVTYKLLSGGTKTVVEFDPDGDGVANFQILMTNGGFTMTADDFILG